MIDKTFSSIHDVKMLLINFFSVAFMLTIYAWIKPKEQCLKGTVNDLRKINKVDFYVFRDKASS